MQDETQDYIGNAFVIGGLTFSLILIITFAFKVITSIMGA